MHPQPGEVWLVDLGLAAKTRPMDSMSFQIIHEEEYMTVKQQLIREIEDLPLDAQEKVLKLIHFVKEEIFVLREKMSTEKKRNALTDVDKIAIETGIQDLAEHHDHYLYRTP
jgi:hypothetical protein